jgi:hypothetical protein
MRRLSALIGWALGALAFKLITGCISEVEPPTQAATFIGPELCAAYGVTCAHVYEFAAISEDNPLGHVELCVDEDDLDLAQAYYGRARLSTSPRFDKANLCIYGCEPHEGCNAYGGCFCPYMTLRGAPRPGIGFAHPAFFTGRIHYALYGAGDVGLGTCDTDTVKPAVSCRPLRYLRFDGCRWRCVSILDLPPREAEQ